MRSRLIGAKVQSLGSAQPPLAEMEVNMMAAVAEIALPAEPPRLSLRRESMWPSGVFCALCS
jgi:hypothetical protein